MPLSGDHAASVLTHFLSLLSILNGRCQAVSEGPRASEQFAAITATFVAGLSSEARAQDIAARFLEQLATKLEVVGIKHY